MERWHKNVMIFSRLSNEKVHINSQNFNLQSLNLRESNSGLIDLKIGGQIVDVGLELFGNSVLQVGIYALVGANIGVEMVL